MEMHYRKVNLLFYGVNEPRDEDIYKTMQGIFIYLGLPEEKARDIKIANAQSTTPPKPTRQLRSPCLDYNGLPRPYPDTTVYAKINSTSAEG